MGQSELGIVAGSNPTVTYGRFRNVVFYDLVWGDVIYFVWKIGLIYFY